MGRGGRKRGEKKMTEFAKDKHRRYMAMWFTNIPFGQTPTQEQLKEAAEHEKKSIAWVTVWSNRSYFVPCSQRRLTGSRTTWIMHVKRRLLTLQNSKAW